MHKALKWTFLAEILLKSTQLISFYLWMKFLSPVELGLASELLLLAAFAQMFWQQPANKYLVKCAHDAHGALKATLTYNTLISIAPLVVLAVIWLGNLGDGVLPQSKLALAIVLAANVLYAVSSTYIAHQHSQDNFRFHFVAKSSSTLSSFISTAGLLVADVGFMSLVYGYFIGSIVQFVCTVRLPFRGLGGRENWFARSAWKFIAGVLLAQMLIWNFNWLDSVVVGAVLGPEELGEYRLSQQITFAIYSLFYSAFTPVYYAHRARITPSELLARVPTDTVRNFCFNALLTCLLLLPATHLNLVINAKTWPSLQNYLVLSIIAQGIVLNSVFFGEVYKLLGRPLLETLSYLLMVLLMAVTYPILVRSGGESLLVAKIVIALSGSLAFNIIVFNYFLEIPMWRALGFTAPFIFMILALAYRVFDRLDPYSIGSDLVIAGVLSIYIYAAWKLVPIREGKRT